MTPGSIPIFVARQPIFNGKQELWGYELLFRSPGERSVATFADPDQATSSVITDGFALATTGMRSHAKVLINFPQNLLVKKTALALPKKQCVVEILETVTPTPEILDALRELKQEGYTLALDDFVGEPGFEPLLELADIVKVDALGLGEKTLEDVTTGLARHKVKLLLEKVENAEVFEQGKRLGYSYFQGYHFSKPEVIEGRKIPASMLSKIELLRELVADDIDMKRISKTISTDVSLTYRLLKYINSSFFGLAQKVDSVLRAVALMGGVSTKQWLMAVLMSDMGDNHKAKELGGVSIERAKFLELLSEVAPDMEQGAESMFLLGLFSKLDALLGQDMSKVLEHISLKDELKRALLGEQTPLREWLDLVEALEWDRWSVAEPIFARRGLSVEQAAALRRKAQEWAQNLSLASH